MHAGPILCLDDVRYCCRSAARDCSIGAISDGPVPRAAAGARSCCMRTSDWDCGCRVEVSRVVSAGAAGACNGAPARRMARKWRAGGPRAGRSAGGAPATRDGVRASWRDPNLLLLIAEVRTLQTGHCASCRTAPLHPVPRSHCETTLITVLGYPAIYVDGTSHPSSQRL